jgi:hypothetical protein
MDDSGVADAFYTVLSIGIVIVAALAVSGVVLSTTMKQGSDAGAQIAGYGAGGMEKGLYGFYYAVDTARSDLSSGGPNDIILKGLAVERKDSMIAFSSNGAPSAAPGSQGAVIWSGYLYVPSDGSYTFELTSQGRAWEWLDGDPVNLSSKAFSMQLSKGYHPIKLKYYYSDLHSASCTLSWLQGGQMVPVNSFYR